jgi:hypothetical protein
MILLLATLLLVLVADGVLPMWGALAALWALALVLLLPHTWRDYIAGTNFRRVEKGCKVTLPPEDERQNEPDAERVVTFILWPFAAVKNFIVAMLAAVFYFRVVPRPLRFSRDGWRLRVRAGDVGLTMLLNRMVDEQTGWRRYKALALRKRWLNRYDHRAVHT